MDLIRILQSRIESLDDTEVGIGLRAILQHVQVAANHLKRGAETHDHTAFTDAIYRTNQAFEGALKEAYRAIAAKDPEKVRPFDIESYLTDNAILRKRVIDQVTRYRTEWRNPSTHDYKLDFDEDEALLAIVSVCAMAIVLTDQIAEKSHFDRAKAAAKPLSAVANRSLLELVVDSLLRFELAGTPPDQPVRETQLIGALAGHLEASIPGSNASTDPSTPEPHSLRADLAIVREDQQVVIEVKLGRLRRNTRGIVLASMAHYIAASGVRDAVLYVFPGDHDSQLEREDYQLPGVAAKVVILAPKAEKPRSPFDIVLGSND